VRRVPPQAGSTNSAIRADTIAGYPPAGG